MKKAAVPSILIAVVMLAGAVLAEAQQPKKIHRIGYITVGGDPSTPSPNLRLPLSPLVNMAWQPVLRIKSLEHKRSSA
jgi:hypothetical protein